MTIISYMSLSNLLKKLVFFFILLYGDKQEDHDGPVSFTWANTYAYLNIKLHTHTWL